MATKVDKVTGKELSTNDYTTAEKTKLAAITGTNTGDQDLSALATNTALALKANTADVTTSLATKANTADVTTSLATKVDKVTGKELSTNDYTTAEKTKLASIRGTNTGDQDLSGFATTTQLATKANSSDVTTCLATKANATDVTTSLATKVDKVTGKELSTNDYTTAEKTKLAAITGTNTGDQDLNGFATTSDVTTSLATKANAADVTTSLATKANATDVTTSLATKVDKVTGKELSTNDYTTAEKTKLAAITGTNTGDQVNITGNAATATLADNISATTNTTLTSLANLATVGTLTSGTISLTTDIATNGNLKAGTVTYPNTHGTSGQVLSTTGSGTLSWTSIPIPDLTNYVTTNTEQTITASKTFSETTTFSKDALINGLTVGRGGGNKAYNTAIGTAALESNSTGSSNTAIGFGALSTNVTGEFNTAIGYLADVGYDNLTNATAIGYGAVALGDNTIQLGNTDVTDVKTSGNLTVNGITVGRGSGNQSGNTAVGISALSNNSDGDGNTASGSSALFNNTEGSGNTASGWRALYLNTTGNNNTVSGSQALLFNADGISNTAIGYRAGRKIADDSGNNTTSDYSVYLGSETKASADGAENEIVIGYNAIGAGSHTIQLGNTAVTNVNTSGAITAGGKIIAGASSAASSSAVLEANSTTQGFLPPRLTTTQRDAIATPAEGLTLWNTTNKQLEVFDGSIWVNMNGELVSTLTVGQSYGGGVVAYIFTVNDPGYVANEQHGLIAATSDQSTGIPWSEGGFSNPQTISTGARGTAIGTGLSNTNTIIGAVGPSTSYAVGLARAHNGGGYTDWYLPSKDELYKLYLNRSAIGGFSGTYWSSTEYDQYDARFLEFGIGTQDYNTKHLNSFKVRAVRTF